MNVRNSNGPSMEPCGTQQDTALGSVRLLLIATH